MNFIYFRYLLKYLRFYINYYLKYKLYKNIILINRLKILFHTIIINFIIIFLVVINEYNYFFIVTDKFFKRVLIFSNRITYDAIK